MFFGFLLALRCQLPPVKKSLLMERALRSVCASCTRKLLLQQKRQQQLILATATRRNTPLRISHHRPYSSIKAAQQPEKIQEINENSELSAEGTLDKANKELEKILTDAAVYEVHPERTLQKVLRIIQELRDRNIPFNLETYERLQSAYAKRGMLSEMMPLLQEMAANDVEPSTRIFHNALQVTTDAQLRQKKRANLYLRKSYIARCVDEQSYSASSDPSRDGVVGCRNDKDNVRKLATMCA